MDQIELVIKKVGAEWCLFTSDGDRKLGCHPSKEAAQAQEAAIKSRQGQAAALCTNKDGEGLVDIALALEEDQVPMLVGSNFIPDDSKKQFLARQFESLGAAQFIGRFGCARVVSMWASFGGSFRTCESKAGSFASNTTLFCGALKGAAGQCGADVTMKRRVRSGVYLFDSRIDTSVAQQLADGSARMDVRLAPEGKDFENGGQTFNLDEGDIKNAIQNFAKRGGPVPVTIGHWPEAERQRQPAAAWIERIFRKTVDGESFVMGTMRFLRKTWHRIVNDEFKYLSMEFWTDDTDQKGNEIGLNIDGAAILNYPFFPLRFDQDKHGGGHFVSLSRFAAIQRGKKMRRITLQDGSLEIKEANGEFCIFDASGESLGCWPTMEEAEAAIAEMAAQAGGGQKLAEVREVDGQFCIFNDAGEQGDCFPTREEAEAAMQTGKKGDGDQVTVSKTELDRLRALEAGQQGDQGKLTNLSKRVGSLEGDKLVLRLGACLRKLREEHKLFIPLGDHNLATAEGCRNFLKARVWGISEIEGWEKLAQDTAETAHLPRVQMGQRVSTGKAGAGSGEPDLNTEAGRAEAIRRKAEELRKEDTGGVLQVHLTKKKQTYSDYAIRELKLEHPTIKWD